MTNRPALPLLLALAAGCGDDGSSVAPDAGVPDAAMPDAPVCLVPRTPDPDPKVEAIAKVLETKWAAAGIPGGALTVLTNGGATQRTVLIGARAPGSCDAVTRDTRYRIGPPSEIVTSIAMVAAADDGLFSLTDPVTSKLALNLSGGTASAIQVRHLLTHSDGLSPTDAAQCGGADLATWYAGWNTQTAWAVPGTLAQWGQNDTQVAGRFLEVASGKSFDQAVHDLVFAPLGITATFDTAAFESGPHAIGLGTGGFPVQPATLDCGSSKPSGQLYASIDDLGKLVKLMAWGNPAVMGASSFDRFVHGMGEPAPYTGDQAGYGLVTFDAGAYDLRYQAGWGAGVTALVYMPHIDTAFAVTMSKEVPDFDKNGVNDILRSLAGSYAPPDTSTAPSTWSEYAGTYTDSVTTPARTLTVTFDGTKLSGTIDVGGGTTVPVTITSAGLADMFTFGYAGRSAIGRFWRTSAGQISFVTGVDWRLGPPLRR